MVVRYMTVLTQISVTMEDILSFYNFSDKDGPRIVTWLSDKSPQHPWLYMLKKSGSQNEMLINEITDVASKNKRKYNTMAEDEVKRKNISKSIKNEKEDLEFVSGMVSIMKVKGDKKWRSRVKNDLMSKLENCFRDEFECLTNDFYTGFARTKDRKQKSEETIESRQVERTRVLNDKWVKMHFQKTFCDKLENKYHH